MNSQEDDLVNDIAAKLILDQTQSVLPEIKINNNVNNNSRPQSVLLSAKGRHE